MRLLFSPFQVGPLTLRNRIVVAPMCQYSAVDGQTTAWHDMHLGSLAISGAGLLIIEATAVTPEGRISPRDLGLWGDAQQAALGRTMQAVRAYAPTVPILVQLAHAGRKASTSAPWEGGGQIAPTAQDGWQTVAPSALPYAEGEVAPVALDAAGLDRIEAAFVAAAKRADALGLSGVELHCAHGYLLHQFLSPLSNRREDAYGGSLENRMRFPLRIVAAVRSVLPATRLLGVRISATDWVAGGWDVEQSVQFTQRVKELGGDYIHVSSGGLSPAQAIPVGPGYQVALAARIKQAVGLPTMTVGLITEPIQAETILASGQANMVALGRAMLYDPRWPWHAAATLGAQVEVPPQYLRSQPHGLKGLFRPLPQAD